MHIRMFVLSQRDFFKVIGMDSDLPLGVDKLRYFHVLVGELTEIILIKATREIDVYAAPVVDASLEGRLLG